MFFEAIEIMKKILLLLTLVGGLFEANAQDQAVGPKSRKKFKIGFQVSPSVDFFTPSTEGIELDKVAMKFSYGMMAEYAFTNNYAIGFGLEHKMAGASLDFKKASVNGNGARYIPIGDTSRFELQTRVYRYDYLNLPITLKLMTNEIGYFTYFGQFGVDVSVLANATFKDEGNLYSNDSTFVGQTGDFTKRYKHTTPINVTLRIGAGAEWNFSGNTSLVFSVSYHHGFIDLMKDANGDKIANDEGLYQDNPADFKDSSTAFDLSANLHQVALNVGILF